MLLLLFGEAMMMFPYVRQFLFCSVYTQSFLFATGNKLKIYAILELFAGIFSVIWHVILKFITLSFLANLVRRLQ